MKFQGAEATVEINEDVTKTRQRKKYRHENLDDRIRKERTSKEADLMKKAGRAGVNVPKILKTEEYRLVMEKIEGSKLKEVPDREKMEKMGEQVAKLHSKNIIHGDLTTSNAITSDQRVFLIDFGLASRSERTEDKAVDLHLLKNILESSHSDNYRELWNGFLDGYRSYEKSDKVEEVLKEVEKRGRYK